MSAVEQMKTRHITSFKASSQGAKTKMKKENGQTGGAGGGGRGGDYYIFPSKEGD